MTNCPGKAIHHCFDLLRIMGMCMRMMAMFDNCPIFQDMLVRSLFLYVFF